MGAGLRGGARGHVQLDLLPLAAIESERLEEAVVLVLLPAARVHGAGEHLSEGVAVLSDAALRALRGRGLDLDEEG